MLYIHFALNELFIVVILFDVVFPDTFLIMMKYFLKTICLVLPDTSDEDPQDENLK